MAALRNRLVTIRCIWPTSSCLRLCPCLSRAWRRRASRMSRSTTTRLPFNFIRTRIAIHRLRRPSRRSSRRSPKPRRSETAKERTPQQWTAPLLSAKLTSNSSQTHTTLATTPSTDSEHLVPNPKLQSCLTAVPKEAIANFACATHREHSTDKVKGSTTAH